MQRCKCRFVGIQKISVPVKQLRVCGRQGGNFDMDFAASSDGTISKKPIIVCYSRIIACHVKHLRVDGSATTQVVMRVWEVLWLRCAIHVPALSASVSW